MRRSVLPTGFLKACTALITGAAMVFGASLAAAAETDQEAGDDLTLTKALSGEPLKGNANTTPRFSERAFLKSLEALIAEQQLKRHNSLSTALTDFKLSLNDADVLPDIRSGGFRDDGTTEREDQSFFYLRDVAVDSDPRGLTARPDFSSLLAPSGNLRNPRDARGNVAGARMGLSLGNEIKSDGTINPGFQIALESAYRLNNQDEVNWADYGGLTEQLADRRYNVGVVIGYSGFNLDAGLRREWTPLQRESFGYDLGFSYQSTSWSARLGWSAYKAGEDLQGFDNAARDFISVELGANLTLSERFGLTGGVRYYEYDDFHIISGDGDRSQMVFLGGRMRF